MTRKIDFSDWNWGESYEWPIPRDLFAHGAQILWNQIQEDWDETVGLVYEPDLTTTLYFCSLDEEMRLTKTINLADDMFDYADMIEVGEARLIAVNLRKLADRIDVLLDEKGGLVA